MDDNFTDSQQVKKKAIQDAQAKKDEEIMKLEANAPTTKTNMGDTYLPTKEDIKKGFKKLRDGVGEMFQKEPAPVKKAKGGLVTRADGAAKRGKTKGRTV